MNWLNAPIRKIAPAIAAQCKFGSDQKIWQLSLDQIERDTGTVVSKRYAVASEAGSFTVLFDEENVLYSKLRPNLNKVVIPDEPGLATTELVPLRPDSVVLIPKFLALYLRSPSFVNQAESHVTGTTLPRVSMSWFWEHLAPLPPPTEQIRIVEIVEDVERIRRLRRGADAVASRIVPALFLEYFGDPTTNPLSWPESNIGSILLKSDHGTGSRTAGKGKGLPIICADNVAQDGSMLLDDLRLTDLSAFSLGEEGLQEGDVLFSHTGRLEAAGKTGIWGGEMDAVFASDLIRLQVDVSKIEPVFFWAFMNSEHMKANFRIGSRPTLGLAKIDSKELHGFSIYVPPLDIQKRFVQKVQAILNLRSSSSSMGGVTKLLESIQHHAFSGQLTAGWRKSNMRKLLAETKKQACKLGLPLPQGISL